MSFEKKESIFEEHKPAVTFFKKASNVKGSNIFNFPNGDIYIGSYGITEQDIIFRAGRGMYICSDKTVLLGDWEDNYLIYGQIKFPNGDEYFGNFMYNSYEGRGRYKIPGVGTILCSFHKSAPIDQMTLVDINGFTWRGEQTENSATLYPVNQFMEHPLFAGDMTVPKTPVEELTSFYDQYVGSPKSSLAQVGSGSRSSKRPTTLKDNSKSTDF